MFKMKSLYLRSISPLFTRVMVPEFNKSTFSSLPIVSYIHTNKLNVPSVTVPVFNVIRYKSKKAEDEDSDEEQGFLDDDKSLTKDSKVIKFTTTSLRTDAVLKSSLGIARNKIEQLFYESKIRVNGRKLLKKSVAVRPEYEIDVIKHISPNNPDHLYIARVEVLSITAKEESIQFTVRRFKNLLIENYETDPYKSGDTQAGE